MSAGLHPSSALLFPIFGNANRQSWTWEDSSHPGIAGCENKFQFQFQHVGPCSCQTSKSLCVGVGEQLKVLLQIQRSPVCFLPAITGWIAVNYFSGLACIVYGITSQNAICCESLNCRRAQRNVQRENCERTNEFLFLPLSICSWEEKKSQEEHAQDVVWLAQSYHKQLGFQNFLLKLFCSKCLFA